MSRLYICRDYILVTHRYFSTVQYSFLFSLPSNLVCQRRNTCKQRSCPLACLVPANFPDGQTQNRRFSEVKIDVEMDLPSSEFEPSIPAFLTEFHRSTSRESHNLFVEISRGRRGGSGSGTLVRFCLKSRSFPF